MKKLQTKDFHQSMRGYLAGHLYNQMIKNKDIYLITGDLGYKVFDKIREDFPERFINVGAAEQTMLDLAVGLSLKGKIPVCYSITPFLLYRGFETLRTYINHERIKVILIGSGRDNDYKHDGFSHNARDDHRLFQWLGSIQPHWPLSKEAIEGLITQAIASHDPFYINLRR